MILKTRPMAAAVGILVALAGGLIVWQASKETSSDGATRSSGGVVGGVGAPRPVTAPAAVAFGGQRASGTVSLPPAPAPAAAPTPAPSASPAPALAPTPAPAAAPPAAPTKTAAPAANPPPAPTPSAQPSTASARPVVPATAPATPPAVKPPAPPRGAAPAAAPTTPVSPVTPKAPTSSAAAPRHRVADNAARPPILPNEADGAIAKALGKRTLGRFLYLDPLARRFVATVDNMGRQPAPTSLWLLKPAPGELKKVRSKGGAADESLIARANSRRYAAFVAWVEKTDTATLIDLYARLYPLLQQTYAELGHPNEYFNDRVVEVIDQLLAAPVVKTPLRVRPASPDKLAALSTPGTPARPHFELTDPALEALTVGQKMLLRVGPQQAAVLKLKLQALRAGLVKLAAR